MLIIIHSWLVEINIVEDVMLLMTYLQKYVFQVKQDVIVKVLWYQEQIMWKRW